jgi:hypothetical protein
MESAQTCLKTSFSEETSYPSNGRWCGETHSRQGGLSIDSINDRSSTFNNNNETPETSNFDDLRNTLLDPSPGLQILSATTRAVTAAVFAPPQTKTTTHPYSYATCPQSTKLSIPPYPSLLPAASRCPIRARRAP